MVHPSAEAPPPLTLSTLDADAVGLDAAARIYAVARVLRGALGEPFELRPKAGAEALRSTPVYQHTAALVAWAQRGEGAPTAVRRSLDTLVAAIAWSPLDGSKGPDALLASLSPADALGLVCHASRVRLRLLDGERVDGVSVALLLERAAKSVRRISDDGALKPATRPTRHVGTLYEAADAIALLAARNVPGFATR